MKPPHIGRFDAGLFFLSTSTTRAQFVPIQLGLARNDLMNEYVRHVGSGIFAVPPGCREGEYLGARLFADAGRVIW